MPESLAKIDIQWPEKGGCGDGSDGGGTDHIKTPTTTTTPNVLFSYSDTYDTDSTCNVYDWATGIDPDVLYVWRIAV